MQIDVLSLFPNMFEPLRESMIGKAIERELLNFDVVDYRSYSHDKHHHVDDTPYGGGAGMLLKPEPLFEAMDGVNERHPGPKRVILMDPAGKKFNHQAARALSQEDHLVFICGHYEGYDERIRTLVTDEY
ncbi:tRNA (guanosine(37)-N1)-methyltransferase TrmD, partial [Lacticaseibacillus paracasei]